MYLLLRACSRPGLPRAAVSSGLFSIWYILFVTFPVPKDHRYHLLAKHQEIAIRASWLPGMFLHVLKRYWQRARVLAVIHVAGRGASLAKGTVHRKVSATGSCHPYAVPFGQGKSLTAR